MTQYDRLEIDALLLSIDQTVSHVRCQLGLFDADFFAVCKGNPLAERAQQAMLHLDGIRERIAKYRYVMNANPLV